MSITAGWMRQRFPDTDSHLAQHLIIERKKRRHIPLSEMNLNTLFVDEMHITTSILLPLRDIVEGNVLENKKKLKKDGNLRRLNMALLRDYMVCHLSLECRGRG